MAETAFPPVDRPRRRRAALRVALRDGDPLSAARAWERLRVRDATLTTQEATAARAARASVGRAIRDARRRRAQGTWRPAGHALPLALPQRSRELQRALLVLGVVAGLALLALALLPQARPGPAPAAAAPQEEATPIFAPSGGRGRVSATLPPVVAQPQTTPASPPPSEEPSPPPPAATVGPARPAAPGAVPGGVAGGVPGGVAGGTPGGVVGGTPGGTGTGTRPAPTPTPNVLPAGTPPPLALGASRFWFQAVDSVTRAPLGGVCVIVGTITCTPSDYHTNAQGYFWFDVPPGGSLRWTFTFVRDPDYMPATTYPQQYQPGTGSSPQIVTLRHPS